MSKNKRWHIDDDNLVNVLRENGFICERPKIEPIPGAISFRINPDAEGDKRWFETNCPIQVNGSYKLPDGRVIRSRGTVLELKQSRKRNPDTGLVQ